VNVGWDLNLQEAEVGDMFTLNMLYVFAVARLVNDTLDNAPFALTADGIQLATCNVDEGGARTLNSEIPCQVTVADLCH
jgi:hypothetical protein